MAGGCPVSLRHLPYQKIKSEADFPPLDFLTHAEADVYLENEVLKKVIVTP